MMDFIGNLFSSDGFMPHGHCYLWKPGVLWLHIASDALIALAYYSIPITLVYFIRKRRDIPFNWMFLCFAIFIIACGTTHLMEIWVIWHPTYWLSGSIKAITAIVSVPTAVLLFKLIPQAVALPSPTDLRATNEKLAQEIAERKRAEDAVRRLNDELELRVVERTWELASTNKILRHEINERQRAEQDSREKQNLLKAIIDNSTTVIYVKDMEGRYILVNRRFLDLFHLGEPDVTGKSDHELFSDENAEAYRAMDQRVIAANRALTEEETVPLDDGLHTYVSVKSPLWDEHGKPYALFGISTDITEHNREAERMKWLATFPERTPNPVIELDFNEGTIYYQNPVARQLFPDLQNRLLKHPYLAGVMEAGELLRSFTNRPFQREVTVDDVHYAQTISYIPESRRLRIYGTNITERKRAEDALKESEMRFRTMANSIPPLAWTGRADGSIDWYNERWYAYTGTTPEQMLGWGWQNVHDPKRLPEVIARWKEAIALGQPFEMEFPLRGADGQFRQFLTRALPLKNEDGTVKQWFGTNTDVDDLKHAEEEIKALNTELEERVSRRTAELEAANRELEAFSYSVSHDLRAPLRAINGFAGIVIEDYAPHLPPQCREYLERMRRGGLRMGELVDDLLTFARLSRQPLTRQPVNVTQMIHDVLNDPHFTETVHRVETRVGNLPVCQADPILLKQVWTNLVSNAIKYSRVRNPSVVEIGSETNKGECVYFVRDNGVGFDMKYVDKLFGVFQRLHRIEEFEGTGVGLAIVHRIVHRHGGRVWAHAEPDRGATFYFTLGKG